MFILGLHLSWGYGLGDLYLWKHKMGYGLWVHFPSSVILMANKMMPKWRNCFLSLHNTIYCFSTSLIIFFLFFSHAFLNIPFLNPMNLPFPWIIILLPKSCDPSIADLLLCFHSRSTQPKFLWKWRERFSFFPVSENKSIKVSNMKIQNLYERIYCVCMDYP